MEAYPFPADGHPYAWFALGVLGVPATCVAFAVVTDLRDAHVLLVVGIAAFLYCAWRSTAPSIRQEREVRRYLRWAESNPDGDGLARLAYPEQLAQQYGGTLPPEVCERLALSVATAWQPQAVRRLLGAFDHGKVPTCADVDWLVEDMVAQDANDNEASIRQVTKSVRDMARSRRAAEGVAWTQRVEVAVSADQLCPFCQDALRSEDGAVSCGACRTVLHRECFGELGGCPTIGCRNNPQQRA